MSTKASANPSPAPNPQPKKRKSKPNALADTLRDWESLLGAVSDHATDLAAVEPYRAALATSMEKVKQVKGLQELYVATKQASTQSLTEVMVEGKDQAIRLRGAIRAVLGPTTEKLKQFGIPPLRRRSLRHKSDPPPEPTPQPEIVATKGVHDAE